MLETGRQMQVSRSHSVLTPLHFDAQPVSDAVNDIDVKKTFFIFFIKV